MAKTPEERFMEAARIAARTPGADQRKAAQKAYDKLPKDSRLRGVKFEGTEKHNWTRNKNAPKASGREVY
jgi:hypothetical protein